jgi:hypothetical protein
LQAYVPKLQSVGPRCLFSQSAARFQHPVVGRLAQMGEAYVAAIHRWAELEGIPIRYFARGENKEAIAQPVPRAAAEQGGEGKVVLRFDNHGRTR